DPGPTLVLANPDYDALGDRPRAPAAPAHGSSRSADDLGRHAIRFERLPGFAAEADAVTKLLRQGRPEWKAVLRTGRDASKESLQAVKRPRLLYLITHGFFLPDLPPPKADRPTRGLELVSLDSSLPLPHLGEDPRLRSGLALAGANRWK